MKQNPDFYLTDVGNDHILVPVGQQIDKFTGVVMLNGMSVALWNMMELPITLDELTARVLKEYDVTEEKAKADISAFVESLRNVGAVLEDDLA